MAEQRQERMYPVHGFISEYDRRMPWENYLRKLKYYFLANQISSEDHKKAILLTVLGDEVLSILCSLISPQQPEDIAYDEILNKLSNHFSPTPNETVECFKFYNRNQETNETIADYVIALRKMAGRCNFTDLDKQLRVRLVCGVKDEKLQLRLLSEKKLSFESAMEIALAYETAQKNVQSIRNPVKPTTPSVTKDSPQLFNVTTHNPRTPSTSKNYQGSRNRDSTSRKPCYRCLGAHNPQDCPYSRTLCNYCKKKGHLAKACKSLNKKKMSENTNQLSENDNSNCVASVEVPSTVRDKEMEKKDELTQLFNVENDPSRLKPVIVDIKLNGVQHKMQIDSGATYSVISSETYRKLWPVHPPELSNSEIQLRLWNSEGIAVEGKIFVDVTLQNKISRNLELLVVKNGGCSLLGRNWFCPLGITIGGISNVIDPSEQWVSRFPSLFDEALGKVIGTPVQIDLKEGASPIFKRSRPVPLPLKEKIENELEKLIKNGTLEPTESSEWATPIVPVRKPDGSVRICMDYRSTVNPMLKSNVYPLPLISDLLLSLNGATVFSNLDLAQAYLQLPVDEASSRILTVNTHKGLFKVRRLPFGLTTAPSIFQRFMEAVLNGIQGIAIYLDDIIVSGKTPEEHDQRMNEVLQRLEKQGLRLNPKKCKFYADSTRFLGFIIDSQGVHPTPEKVEAIKNVPIPKNKTELQSFLGLINFYNSFLQNKATIAEPLHRLLHKDAIWKFEEKEIEAFNKLKNLLSSDDILVHYDPEKEIILSCDASPFGLGAVLAHASENGPSRPIAFASRTLSSTERNYSQIDREALAIIYGLKKFDRYVIGRKITILTDHKPLLGLLGADRPIPPVISPRMLRWSILMSSYDYTLKYCPGKKLANADSLSRLPIDDPSVDLENTPEVYFLDASNPPVTVEDIVKATKKDKILSKVMTMVLHGVTDVHVRDPTLNPYLRRIDELTVLKDCLIWGHRVVVPTTLRHHLLQELHVEHPGIVAMKALARSYFWWPGLDRDIERYVSVCEPCQQTRHLPPKAPPIRWERPERKWSRLHLDLMGPIKKVSYLIVVDSFSKWLEVEPLSSACTATIVSKLRKIFATHGIPEVLVTDNGSVFTSSEFAEFTQLNGIYHILIPPAHPSSNGQAERYIQTTKDALRRTLTEDNEIELRLARFLLHQHITPNAATSKSPAELLYSRKLRTAMDLCHPERNSSVPPRLIETPRRFTQDQPVYMLNFTKGEKWIPARIVRVVGERLYEVRTQDNRKFMRHIDQLRRRDILIP